MKTLKQVQGIIYGLFDPRTGELRYVGKTTRLLRLRLKNHMMEAKRQTHYRARWIRQLVFEGLKPQIDVLELCSVEELEASEIWHIAYWKWLGCRLTNGTAGGDGGMRSPSDETRASLSSSNKARHASKSIEGWWAGKKRSDATRARQAEATRERYASGRYEHEKQRIASLARIGAQARWGTRAKKAPSLKINLLRHGVSA